jgi:phosphohistidine phosphatase
MKTWVMVRHAKSSWEFNLPDRVRPLADRGVKDAILVSQELNKHNLHIDQVYSSPAKRAFDTALIMASELGLSTENIQIEEELYDFMG